MIDVFFDGKCGLCSREIEYYRNIANDGIFNWHNIAQDPSPLNKFKIPQSIALRWLHLRDENGQWHIGADAFLVIWMKLERWNYLALFLKLPATTIWHVYATIRLLIIDLIDLSIVKLQLKCARRLNIAEIKLAVISLPVHINSMLC